MRRRTVVVAELLLAALVAVAVYSLLVTSRDAGHAFYDTRRTFERSWQAFLASPVSLVALAGFVAAEGAWLSRKRLGWPEKITRVGLHGAAALYAAVLVAVTLFPADFGGLTVRRFVAGNWVPFSGIAGWFSSAGGIDSGVAAKDVLGNAAVFVPFGVLAPLLWPRLRTWARVVAAGAAVGLALELLQGLLDAGDPNFDDMMLNTIGVAAGFALFRLGQGFLKPMSS